MLRLPPGSVAEEAIDVNDDNPDQEEVATAAEASATHCETTNQAIAEQAVAAAESVKDYPCDVCDKTFETLKGLRTHTGKQHKTTSSSPIPQIDGADDNINEPTYCQICKKCHEETKNSEDLNYHVMNNHEVNSVFEAYGHEWVNKRRYCIRRNCPFHFVFLPH